MTPGSNAVIGTGTAFIRNARVGDAFRGPDGEWYEVINIASDMALSIAPNYQGGAVAAGGYSLAPMQGYVKDSADALRAATQVIASGVADMQEQVAAATEAAESAGQSKAVATDQADIATDAANASSENKETAQIAAQQSGSSAMASGSAADRAENAKASIIQSEQAAAASAAAAAESAEHAEEVTRGKAASGANSDITSLSGLTVPLSNKQGGNGGDSTPYLPSANANIQLNNGKYSTQNSWTGSPYPGTNSKNYGYLEHFNWVDNQQQFQIWTSLDTSLARQYRFKASGAWGAWGSSVQSPSWGSIAGDILSQADLQQALGALSSRVGASMVSVNGGANLAVNQIYTVTNPFPNETIICEAQVLFGGVWANPRWFGTSGTTTYGTMAGQRFSTTAPGDIYVRTGISAMTVEPTASGSAFAAGMGNQTALPCRVLVWRVKS